MGAIDNLNTWEFYLILCGIEYMTFASVKE